MAASNLRHPPRLLAGDPSSPRWQNRLEAFEMRRIVFFQSLLIIFGLSIVLADNGVALKALSSDKFFSLSTTVVVPQDSHDSCKSVCNVEILLTTPQGQEGGLHAPLANGKTYGSPM